MLLVTTIHLYFPFVHNVCKDYFMSKMFFANRPLSWHNQKKTKRWKIDHTNYKGLISVDIPDIYNTLSVTKLRYSDNITWSIVQAYTRRCRTFFNNNVTKQYTSIHWFPRGGTLRHYGEYKTGKLSYPIRLISLQIQHKAAATETKHNI